jgi:trans-aconitate 2-methyltransferase
VAERKPSHTGPLDWDAETYDEVSDPQFEWGMEVLERLELNGDERVLDAGCGSGRVTAELARRLPRGEVVAADGSAAMIAKARERLGDQASYLLTDLLELELEPPADLIFSTATFHWVLDHESLFARLRGALRPGGRLVAQCGGEGNVAEHAEAIAVAAAQPRFSPYLDDPQALWNFAGPEETEQRLREAGFAEVSCWLQPKPVTPERPLDFVMTATIGPQLDLLPEELRRPFAEAVLDLSAKPLVLRYMRLNIEARRRVPAS